MPAALVQCAAALQWAVFTKTHVSFLRLKHFWGNFLLTAVLRFAYFYAHSSSAIYQAR